MPKKLLSLLAEEITEQGFGRYFKDATLPSGERIGDVKSVDLSTGKPIDITISKDVDDESDEDIYDDDIIYQEDALLGYHPRAKKDKDDGIINPNVISDIIKALKIANISAEIHYARTGHKRHVKGKPGVDSRHWTGNGVDLSVIDGVGNSGGDGSNKGLCCPNSSKFMAGGDKIVAALETLGYTFGERGKTKGYLWRTDTGGNHWNHVHVSNTNRSITGKIKKDNNDIVIDNKSGLIYASLPSDVKKAIDKLKTDWGVTITDYHLKKEMSQEGKTVADAGRVNNEANRQIKKLIKDCKKQFKKITTDIVSGYRSYKEQVDNFGDKVKNDFRTIEDVQSYNTIPGFSQHHTGRAFDIFSTEPSWWNTNSDVKKWVEDNANSYGFEITYKTDGILRKKEPWHLFYK